MTEYPKKCIGQSQFGTLILCGCRESMVVEKLCFSERGRYLAFITDENAVVGSQYNKVVEFTDWLKIYDDEGLSLFLRGKKIVIYQSPRGECLIKVVRRDSISGMAS